MFATVPSSEGKGGQLAFCLFSFFFKPSNIESDHTFHTRLDREQCSEFSSSYTCSSVHLVAELHWRISCEGLTALSSLPSLDCPVQGFSWGDVGRSHMAWITTGWDLEVKGYRDCSGSLLIGWMIPSNSKYKDLHVFAKSGEWRCIWHQQLLQSFIIKLKLFSFPFSIKFFCPTLKKKKASQLCQFYRMKCHFYFCVKLSKTLKEPGARR